MRVCVCVFCKWVGVLYNAGIRVLGSGGGVYCMVSHIGVWCEWLETFLI